MKIYLIPEQLTGKSIIKGFFIQIITADIFVRFVVMRRESNDYSRSIVRLLPCQAIH